MVPLETLQCALPDPFLSISTSKRTQQCSFKKRKGTFYSSKNQYMSKLVEQCLNVNGAAQKLTEEGLFVEAINELNGVVNEAVPKLSSMSKSLKSSVAPTIAIMLSNRAFNFLKLSCFSDAERDARSACELDAAEPQHKQLLARILYEMGKPRDAAGIIDSLPREVAAGDKMAKLREACCELERIGLTSEPAETVATLPCDDGDAFAPNAAATLTFRGGLPPPSINEFQQVLRVLCSGELAALCNSQDQTNLNQCFQRVYTETTSEVLRLRGARPASVQTAEYVSADCREEFDALLRGLAFSFCSCFPPSTLAAASQIFASSGCFPPFLPAERYRRMFVEFAAALLRHDRKLLRLVETAHSAQAFLETFVPQSRVKEPVAYAMLPIVCALFAAVAPNFVQQFFSRQRQSRQQSRQQDECSDDGGDPENQVEKSTGNGDHRAVHYRAVTAHHPVNELALQFSKIFVFYRLKSSSTEAQTLANKFIQEFVPQEVHGYVKQQIDSEIDNLLRASGDAFCPLSSGDQT